MASSEGIPDFGLFMEVQPDGTSLTFYDFCKVFFLGDLTEVVKLSTFGYARTLADDLDPEQSSPENRLKYIGDPVKQAMLLQILSTPDNNPLPLHRFLCKIHDSLHKKILYANWSTERPTEEETGRRWKYRWNPENPGPSEEHNRNTQFSPGGGGIHGPPGYHQPGLPQNAKEAFYQVREL